MPRKVLLVGSSGGGAAHLGLGGDVLPLVSHVDSQLRCVGAELAGVQLVAAMTPFDSASRSTPATLWYRRPGARGLQCVRGELGDINELAVPEDVALAAAVADGEADGLIMVSADVDGAGVNSRVVAAAALARIPCVGTGGSSISAASAAGARVVGNSGGSVGTAPLLKALSFAVSLGQEWGVPYRAGPGGSVGLVAPVRSSLEGSLPVFISAMLLRKVGDGLGDIETRAGAEALPAAVGAAAALTASGVGEPAALAGAAAGAMCAPSPFLAAVVGVATGRALASLGVLGARCCLPTTATACLIGGTGVVAGACARPLVPFAVQGTDAVRRAVQCALSSTPWGHQAAPLPPWLRAVVGSLTGVLFSWGSQRGAYHSVLFPCLLVEMGNGEVPLLGAFDSVCLCSAGAGVCAAQLLVPAVATIPRSMSGVLLPGMQVHDPVRADRVRSQAEGERSLALRGLLSNMLLGDMVEAAYPFTERCSVTSAAYHLGAAAAGAVLAVAGATGSAYLPVPAAAALSSQPKAFAVASAIAFAVPCVAASAANCTRRRKQRPPQQWPSHD